MTSGVGTGVRPAAYLLAPGILRFGLVAACLVLLMSLDLFASALVMALFALIAWSWRADILPVLPCVLAYQWCAMASGYLYFAAFGYYPVLGDAERTPEAVLIFVMALFCVLAGFRIGLAAFSRSFDRSLRAPDPGYRVERLFWLTVALFSINFAFDVLPKSIWFGGAQILYSLLALRFIPFFILLVVSFSERRGYGYALAGTGVVILPELLTGFSGFKEILLIVLIAAAWQWQPWLRTRRQAAINSRVVVLGLVGVAAILWLGLAWSAAVKFAWREMIWEGQLDASPVERMMLFFDVAGAAVSGLDLEAATSSLVQRLSSGTMYFSSVLSRVPDIVPHQDGALLGMAIENATTPRFLFPDKPVYYSDSWIVREFAGLWVSGAESDTSVGLGWAGEFYIDFGLPGVIGLSAFYGLAAATCLAVLAQVAANREIFFAVMAGFLTEYLMSADGSFIKLFPGMVQRAVIAAVILMLLRGPVLRLVTRTGSNRVGPSAAIGRGGYARSSS